MQSTTSSDNSLLRAQLDVLRESNVATAKFGHDGTLLEVSFFPDFPDLSGKDEAPAVLVDNEVDAAQRRLATGAHRVRNDDGA